MKNLASVLRKWRLMNELGVRDAAKIIGIHFSTLSRFESGGGGLDGKTLAKVLAWLLR